MTDDIAIRIENLGKMYRVYDRPADRLKQMMWGRHLSKGYGREFWALKNFSCTVRKGEMLGVIGRNGSGKSTLLQMVAGTLEPTTGHVKMHGRVSALLELGSGFNPEYSGRDNVFIAGAILGISADEMRQRYDEIVDFSGIGEFIDQPVKTYSSGMSVRLAFAVASSIEPDILIVDEALAVGDMVFQQKCFRRFKQVRQRGTSILFVSHDLSSVIQFCDRAIILQKGAMIEDGQPKAMADLYKKLLAEELAPVHTQNATELPLPRDFLHTAFQLNPNGQDYGNGFATIEDFGMIDDTGIPVRIVAPGQPVTVILRIRFHQICHDPIAAFTIRDLKGQEIAGTNTWYEGRSIGRTQPGQVITVRFRQELPLQAGGYAMSLGCTEHVEGGLTVHHRLYDVLLFEAATTRRFVGLFDMQPEITIEGAHV
jgi:teichoic acid transport system ATP-binding protein